MAKRRTTSSQVKVTYQDGTSEMKGPRDFTKSRPPATDEEAARRTKHWRRLAKLALKRADGRCEDCRDTRGHLVVFRVNHERIGHERAADVLALCRRCSRTRRAWAKRRAANTPILRGRYEQ